MIISCWELNGAACQGGRVEGAYAIVEHFQEHQSKVAAFVSGLHRRLGSGSMVSQMDEQLLVLI